MMWNVRPGRILQTVRVDHHGCQEGHHGHGTAAERGACSHRGRCLEELTEAAGPPRGSR
jgi:hypothetical protein